MRKIVVIALFLAVSLFTTAQQRIIGGSAVDISQRPYQAAIFINGIFNGGGTIISPYHILTAAHVGHEVGSLCRPRHHQRQDTAAETD